MRRYPVGNFVHVRRDYSDGSKSFSWEGRDGSRGLGGVPVSDLPLYGDEELSSLPDGTKVYVVEGEQAKDALRWAGLDAAGTVTGAAAIPGDEALSRLVRLQPCLWADNDPIGGEHINSTAGRLTALGARNVELLIWPDAPPKGDAADFIRPFMETNDPVAARAAVETLPRRLWSPDACSPRSHMTGSSHPTPLCWPDPIASDGLRGLAGDVVRTIDPHTEADPASVLLSFLTAFGNAVGDRPHVVVSATRHPARLFAAVVGETARARKGDSWAAVHQLMAIAAPGWADSRIQGGLSSGEGLVSAVRDAQEETDRKTGETRTVEPGVEDKRLLVVEPELARTLRVMRRDASTLSAILRQAWDEGDLRVMTKTQLRASRAHVSIIGHITLDELRRELDETSLANGFANRFLWAAVKRSKLLPEPVPFAGSEVEHLAARLAEAISFARGIDAVARDEEARQIWAEVYPALTADRSGMLGAVLNRTEAQAVRLSLLFALLDLSPIIRREHLLAALAVLDYSEASCRLIFGDRLGDPVADAILEALHQQNGMTRTDISHLFDGHLRAERMRASLGALQRSGKVTVERRNTVGRPVEVWRLAATPSPCATSELSEVTGAHHTPISPSSLSSRSGQLA
jgi:hypothetical protein